MTSRRRPSLAKRGLLAGAALIGLSWSGLAQAQTPVVPPSADGLAAGQLYMEADLVIRDDKTQVTTARGDVEVRYEGRTLRASELVYDQANGVITAKGSVVIINPDKSVEYADEVVLDDTMSSGAISGFSARMPQNVKLAAASVLRRSERDSELTRAIFTPCDICAADGSNKAPTWSIKADKVVQDRDHQPLFEAKPGKEHPH